MEKVPTKPDLSPLDFMEKIVALVREVTTKVEMEIPRAYFDELNEEVIEEYKDSVEATITSEKVYNQTFSMAELHLHKVHFTFYIKD